MSAFTPEQELELRRILRRIVGDVLDRFDRVLATRAEVAAAERNANLGLDGVERARRHLGTAEALLSQAVGRPAEPRTPGPSPRSEADPPSAPERPEGGEDA
jgi:hypothetical protein